MKKGTKYGVSSVTGFIGIFWEYNYVVHGNRRFEYLISNFSFSILAKMAML
jgi:hypothetical protein